ncbi:MAG: hypothetical protein GBAus27B_000094 [Mycoplasmataceae bacterium]|nr:MAG: hypothetical protein GBAus27B_000094 [Mycoplasmataceae bacterium]
MKSKNKIAKNIKSQLKQKPKTQLKRPLQVNCFKCSDFVEIRWNRGQGKYVEKNNWKYWTLKDENDGKYICGKCLLFIYKNDKWTYLENITDEGRRRVFRSYLYDKTLTPN